MTYPVNELDGIAPGFALRLKTMGLRTTTKFLDAAKTPKARRVLSEKTGHSEQQILRYANFADRMRIKGVGYDYAQLLEAAGVCTVKELAYRNPGKLAQAMAEANEKRKLARLLPSENTVGRWIASAKKLPIKISYR